MIDLLSKETFRTLAETVDGPCVSLYLPTHRAGREIDQDRIRLQNGLRRARSELVDGGMRGPDADQMLEPAEELGRDRDFWVYAEDGLALLIGPAASEAYRLPVAVGEVLVVANGYHLKPLLELLAGGDEFYVLALSQNAVRLLRGSRFRVGELVLRDVPQSLAESLEYADHERQLQSRGAAKVGRGRVVAAFHGHSAADRAGREDLLGYFRAVDEGVRQIIGAGPAPLVLAGVASLFPLYEEASRYQAVVSEGIEGNPERLSADELHERAWPIVEPMLGERRQSAAAALAIPDRPTARALGDVLAAASEGRVDTLFVAAREHRWGAFDPQTGRVQVNQPRQPGDRDLLDMAASLTWVNGGTVFAVAPEDVPDNGQTAALLRY